MAGVYFSELIT